MKRLSLRSQGLETCGFFVVRRPLLSWADFEAWCASGAGDNPATGLRAHLRQLIDRPDVRESLWVATEQLARDVPVWVANPASEHGRRIEQALVRYVSRLCGRATPFGLFAGFATGAFSTTTALDGATASTWRRQVRFDMGYCGELVRTLAQVPAVRRELRYTVNTTVYECGGGYRWVEIVSSEQQREHRLAFVERDPVVDAMMAACASPKTWAELVTVITDAAPDGDGADHYIDGAIDAQLLVPDIEPPLTGRSPAVWLAKRLATVGAPEAAAIRAWLVTAIAQMEQIQSRPLGADGVYQPLLATMAAGPVADAGLRQLQVDLHSPEAGATISERHFEDAIADFPRLWSIFAADPPRQIREFADRFTDRFGDAEVPLMLALDPDWGVGYGALNFPPTPLLDKLYLSAGEPAASDRSLLDDFCDRRLRELARTGEREWNLTDDELETMENLRRPVGRFDTAADRFPESILVKCTLLATDQSAALAGRFVVQVDQATGPTAIRPLSRFAAHDPLLTDHLVQLAEHEARSVEGAIIAELVHLPVDRLGNVLLRPALRQHEISVLVAGGASPEDTIPASDLMVRVENGLIVLRSRRLGVDVVARNSTAHNFTLRANIPVYRFLSELQQLSPTNMRWPLMGVVQPPFLPRVRYRQLILRPATWFLNSEERQRILEADDPGDALREWAHKHGLPRRSGYYVDENVLPVDFDNPLSAASVAKLMTSLDRPMFVELWPESLPPVTVTGATPFIHELLVPLRRRSVRTVSRGRPRTALPLPDIESGTFVPGTEWLYLRLYCGEAISDTVLTSVIAPWLEDLRSTGCFDRWHFLRYRDTAPHLRVRLHGGPDLLGTAMARLTAHLDRRLVWKVDLGTYVRESGRYGGLDAIALVEQLFSFDSDACLAVLSRSPDDAERSAAALAGLATLLDDAGLTTDQAIEFLERHRDSYTREFGVTSWHRQTIGARYREQSPLIDAALGRAPAGPEVTDIRAVFNGRSHAARPIWEALRRLERDGRLVGDLEAIVASLLHMHVNRLARTKQRAQELVLTDFLLRHRRMVRARNS